MTAQSPSSGRGEIGPCQTWSHQTKGLIHGVEVRGDDTWMHVRLVGDHQLRWLSPGRARSGEVSLDGEVMTLRRSFMTLVADDVPAPPAVPPAPSEPGERAMAALYDASERAKADRPAPSGDTDERGLACDICGEDWQTCPHPLDAGRICSDCGHHQGDHYKAADGCVEGLCFCRRFWLTCETCGGAGDVGVERVLPGGSVGEVSVRCGDCGGSGLAPSSDSPAADERLSRKHEIAQLLREGRDVEAAELLTPEPGALAIRPSSPVEPCGALSVPHGSAYVCTLPSGHEGDHAQQSVIASWSARADRGEQP